MILLTPSWANKGVHTSAKCIRPKVNIIAWLDFELVYFEAAVQHFNHYITATSPNLFGVMQIRNTDMNIFFEGFKAVFFSWERV